MVRLSSLVYSRNVDLLSRLTHVEGVNTFARRKKNSRMYFNRIRDAVAVTLYIHVARKYALLYPRIRISIICSVTDKPSKPSSSAYAKIIFYQISLHNFVSKVYGQKSFFLLFKIVFDLLQ